MSHSEDEHHKKMRLAKTRAEVVRTVVGVLQLVLTIITLIAVLSR